MFTHFKILLPGRLTKWKGQEMFLEAIKLLKTKYYKTNFKAVILGNHIKVVKFFSKNLFQWLISIN